MPAGLVLVNNVQMDPQHLGRPKIAKAAASTRKRRGSEELGGSAKRHALMRMVSSQCPGPAEQLSGKNNTDAVEPVEQFPEEYYQFMVCYRPFNWLRANWLWQCDRCKKSGDFCDVDPIGPCNRCKVKKQKCSLMLKNPNTGKTDRHPPMAEDFLKFHTAQAQEKHAAGVKKGKRRAHKSPDTGEPEASPSVPSPSDPLSALQGLTLESGGSSAGNTPANSTLFQPPSLRRLASAPSSSPKSCRTSEPSPGESISDPV